ncbi:MAG: formate--tetrahydrofolate ligase [Candidatus Omnitrophica bacterium]|nr:formate--tetrahydrofolate ligase [Candidatus Omnitrophota bacterium]
MLPIMTIAKRAGIPVKYLELYGNFKAKVSLELLKKSKPRGKYIVVTGITPTHLGEGKTVTTIGLAMALAKTGKRSVACIRQPSLGPLFGVKGGGLGGGRAEIVPQEDIGLHLTGDIHAVEAAHNLAAAFLDNHIFRGNKLNIDVDKIFWKRVADVNDRSLRYVRVGMGGGAHGLERDTGFDITAASEIMAILALSESLQDLRKRLGRIVIALDKKGKPTTCEDLKVAGAMAVILKDALKPNLAQTSEGTPCFIHTGPFANITHGNSSIIADRIALGLADYVVTEAGFGADCGLEKFADIKCRASGLVPSVVVLVASVRALKVHSGRYKMVVGHPLDRELSKENLDALDEGCVNLDKQIENARVFDLPVVVVINRFPKDTAREIAMVKARALRLGAFDCVTSDVFRFGSKGGVQLARAVTNACRTNTKFRPLYPLDIPVKEKISIIAKKIYGASAVSYSAKADENIKSFEKLGFGRLPICMAKTHLSLSHDPKLKGAPRDFVLPVNDVRPSIGAGFLYAICGNVMTMPALPERPVGERIDIDSKGRMAYVHK